jgi:hypothetical protein
MCLVSALQDVGKAERAATYSSASTEVTVSVTGQGKLINGHGSVIFDENFRDVITEDFPVIITVTPLGPSNGVYISRIMIFTTEQPLTQN